MAVRCNVIEVITNKLFGEKCCDKTPHLLKSQTRSSKLKRWADTRTHTHPDPEGRSRFKKSVAKWFFRNSSLHTHLLTRTCTVSKSECRTDSTEQRCKREKKYNDNRSLWWWHKFARTLCSSRYFNGILIRSSLIWFSCKNLLFGQLTRHFFLMSFVSLIWISKSGAV